MISTRGSICRASKVHVQILIMNAERTTCHLQLQQTLQQQRSAIVFLHQLFLQVWANERALIIKTEASLGLSLKLISTPVVVCFVVEKMFRLSQTLYFSIVTCVLPSLTACSRVDWQESNSIPPSAVPHPQQVRPTMRFVFQCFRYHYENIGIR